MVILENDVSIYHDGKEGVYSLASELVNSKPYWIKENQKFALWFDPESNSSWNIGAMSDVGTSIYGIASMDNALMPFEATNWEYQKGRNWIHTTDVKVTGKNFQMNMNFNEQKTIKLIFLEYVPLCNTTSLSSSSSLQGSTQEISKIPIISTTA